MITYDQTKAVLTAIANVKPDYVYPKSAGTRNIIFDGGSCDYVRDGKPSCIAAQVFVANGVPVDVLGKYEGKSAISISSYFDYEHKAGLLLHYAQLLQDGGIPWGAAVRQAIAEIEEG